METILACILTAVFFGLLGFTIGWDANDKSWTKRK